MPTVLNQGRPLQKEGDYGMPLFMCMIQGFYGARVDGGIGGCGMQRKGIIPVPTRIKEGLNLSSR